MIPKEVLDIPKLGAYNIHGALLPKYRGRACINGQSSTVKRRAVRPRYDGISRQGDIIAQKAVPIESEDTAHDVFLRHRGASRYLCHPLSLKMDRKEVSQDESAHKFGGAG